MTIKETALTFQVDGNRLLGIIHKPDQPATKTGLLIVVGGPQYRVGAHRQYIHLARHAAKKGIPVMRFDYRGVGDSEGEYPGFEHVRPDIHAATDNFQKQCPQLEDVVIWGLCEGASAILLGGCDHKSVKKIILVNPWVRTESGHAKAMVKYYYLERLKDPEFWKKIFSGNFGLFASVKDFFKNLRGSIDKKTSPSPQNHLPFPERMLEGIKQFNGQSLLIQSGKDLTAREFDALIKSSAEWKRVTSQKSFTRIDLKECDHTFSSETERVKVAEVTSEWILSNGK